MSDSAPEAPQLLTWPEIHCQDCPMWEAFPFEEECPRKCGEKHMSARGLCRADFPSLHVDEEKGVWPATNFDDWCEPGRELVLEAQAEDEPQAPPTAAPAKRPPRPLALALLFIALNVADALLTAWAVSRGGGEVHEVNPFMRWMLSAGFIPFFVTKIGLGVALAGWLWVKCPQSLVLRLAPIFAGTVLLWNILTLLGF